MVQNCHLNEGKQPLKHLAWHVAQPERHWQCGPLGLAQSAESSPDMGKQKASKGQLALPLEQPDGAIAQLAGLEAKRTAVSAAKELRSADLLSTVTGMSYAQAEEVLKTAGGAHRLAQLPDYALQALPHIGPKRAKQIRAMTDWGLVLSAVEEWQAVQLRNPADVANLMMMEMGLLDQEELRVVALDTKNYVVDVETVYKGSVNSAVVRIAELLRLPIALQCSGMIMLHNHPTGDPTPSPEDVRITELVRESAQLLDIDLLDHLIIGRNRFVSLKERGLGFG